MQTKHHITISAILILLAACSIQPFQETGITQQPSANPPIETFTPISIDAKSTSTSTQSPTSTIQPIPTQTLTPSVQIPPTTTSTPVDLNTLPKLRNVIISAADIKNNDEVSWNTLIIATDTTNELQDSCLWDCVKYRYSLKEGVLTIILLRAGDHQKAENTVEHLKQEFLKTSDPDAEYTVDDLSNMSANSWALVDSPSYKDTRTGASSVAFGDVVILVTYTQTFCEYTEEFGRYCEGNMYQLVRFAVDILNWQIEKLETAGYPN